MCYGKQKQKSGVGFIGYRDVLQIDSRSSVGSSVHCSMDTNTTMRIKSGTGLNDCCSHEESCPDYVDDDPDSEKNGE